MRRGTEAFALLAVSLLCAPVLAEEQTQTPDVIVVKGDRLRGHVVDLGPDGIEFDTIYGDGNVVIPYKDVEHLVTSKPYRVKYGVDGQASGLLLGVEGEDLLVGDSIDSAQHVPWDTIRQGVSREQYRTSWYARLKQRYPLWRGDIDLGFDLEEGAVVKRKVEAGIRLVRDAAPVHYKVNFDFTFEVQETPDTQPVVTSNEFQASLLMEYDISRHGLLFGTPAAARDVPRGIRLQVYPAGGLGYRVLGWNDIDVTTYLGAGVVYNDYIGFPDETYPAGYLGVSYRHRLPRGSILRLSTMYMPSMTGIDENWLWRSTGSLTIPLLDPLAVRFKFLNVNDNVPSPDVGDNKFTTFLGLVLKL